MQKRKIILVVVCSALLLASAKNFSQYYKSDLDMRRLYNSIPAAVPGRTDYFIYRENNMFGLQFYLDGSLKRVRGQSDTGRPGVDLEAVINNIKTGSDKRKTVFVVRKNNTSLERRLEEAGIPLNKRRASGSFYIISLREGSLGPSER